MKKRILALFMAILMLLSLVPMTAFAVELPSGAEWLDGTGTIPVWYKLTENTPATDPVTYTLTVGGEGAMQNYPNSNSQPWKDIRGSITSVIISSGVTHIGECAFQSFASLNNIRIPTSVESIANHAFRSCGSLTSVTIPASVTTIGNSVFRDCQLLESVTLEANTPPTLGTDVFKNCSAVKIYVPAGSVEAYKVADGWSGFVDIIEAIPTYYAIINGTPQSGEEKNHGYITIDKETAAEGDTVTVTVKPADGYKLKSLTAVPAVLTFKAVYDTTDSKNTLTFYYDALDHSGDNITVYEDGTANFLFDDTKSSGKKWGYDGNRSKVKSVVIDESVKNYAGLTSTAYMFSDMYGAESISGAEYLDVSNVTDMSNMFYTYGGYVEGFNAVPNVSGWNTGNVKDMSAMFRNYGYYSTALDAVPNVSGWNTGNVKDMSAMFRSYGYYSTALDAVPNVSGWNTGNVTNMSILFGSYGYSSTALDTVPNVSGWKTGNVTNMSSMFSDYGCTSTALNAVPDVSGWNTGNVTNMSSMFSSYGGKSTVLNAVPDVSGWNTGNVTDMLGMFSSYGGKSTVLNAVPDVSNWNTAEVTCMWNMFLCYGQSSTVLTAVPNVSKWNTAAVTDVRNMFNCYGYNSTVLNFTLDLSGWSVASVTSYNGMFTDAGKKATTWSVIIPAKTGERANETTKWYVGDGSDTTKYIAPAGNRTFTPDTRTFKAVYDTTDSKNTLTFYYDAVDHSGENVTVYEDGTENILFDNSKTSGKKWGYNSNRSSIKSVVFDKSVKAYTGLTSTAYMLQGMTSAGNISGAEYLDVSNVTTMSYMFRMYGYQSAELTAVPDVSKWNTEHVTDMMYMFSSYGYNSTVLNAVPDVSGWNTDNVTTMSDMFDSYGHKSTVLNAVPDVSKWNTGNVTDMSYMFYYYGDSSTVLTAVPDVSGWNTGKVTDMSSMFNSYGTTSTVLNFTLDLSKWSVAKVTNYSSMFYDAGKGTTTWSVTIPAKTGKQANETTKWYVGDGTNTGKYIAPATGKAFTLAAPAISKAEDVLATVEDFPTSTEKAWGGNKPMNSCYIDGDNLKIGGIKAIFLPLTTDVSGSGDDFTCSYNSVTFTFNMTEGKLTSIEVNGSWEGSFDGTYAPAAPASKLLKSAPAKSLKSTPAEPEVKFELQTDGTYQFKMPGYPVVITAEFEKIPDAELISEALTGTSETSIPGVMDITTNILGVRTVKLLKNIDMGNKDVTVAENVFLDFNHFALTTTGKLTNNGVIILHRENADIVEDLLYKVPGNYAADEELKLPTDVSPDYVIPAQTFMTSEVGTDPAYQELSFASGDDMLVWNKDVPAGVQIDVTYSLTLGGDIIGAKGSNVKPTKVTATNVALNDNIMIGGNDGEGEASLVIESIPGDDVFPETVGTFTANGKKITLGKSGKLVISSNITFDESVLISGADGMTVAKTENKTDGTVTYFLETPHTHAPVLVNGQAATETAAGWKDYYECDCGKFFEDAEGKVEITDLNAWKAKGGAGYIAKLETSPETGDSHTSLWAMLLALSSVGFCACFVLGKKRKYSKGTKRKMV